MFLQNVYHAQRFVRRGFGFAMSRLFAAANRRKNEFREFAKAVDSSFGGSVDYSIGTISESLKSELLRQIHDGSIGTDCPSRVSASSGDHLLLKVDEHSRENLSKMDDALKVHRIDMLSYRSSVVARLHDEIRALFARAVGSPFSIVNTRMWTSSPKSERWGPNALHLDGFESGHLKVMVYLSALNDDEGYLVLGRGRTARSGTFNIKDLPSGTAVLFKNSDLIHAGVPGLKLPRISIEVTLMRSFVDTNQWWPGHFFGRHLTSPSVVNDFVRCSDGPIVLGEDVPNRMSFPRLPRNGLRVNLGSGRVNWRKEGWLCLDAIQATGVTMCEFTPETVLPFADRSVSLIYTSHCLEHLDGPTVVRLLGEIRRICASDGLILVKIPDYDWFLRQFHCGGISFMENKGIESVVGTWRGRIEDTVVNRLLMMFCGYWNKAYGSHFTLPTQGRGVGAFHGPPTVEEARARQLLQCGSAKAISESLNRIALQDPDFLAFNHQSAWTSDEFARLLRENGISLVSTDRNALLTKFEPEIPDFRSMHDWSLYCLATPC